MNKNATLALAVAKSTERYEELILLASRVDGLKDARVDIPVYAACAAAWIHVVDDLCGRRSSQALRALILSRGLYSAIRLGDSFAKEYLACSKGEEYSLKSNPFAEIIQLSDCLFDAPDSKACEIILQVSRFAKRFTPNNGGDASASVKKFVGCAKKCSYVNSHWDVWPGQAIQGMVREALREMLIPRGKFLERVRASECCFSSGASLVGSRTTRNQLVKLEHTIRSNRVRYIGSHDDPIYLYDYTNSNCSARRESFFKESIVTRKTQLLLVPKDFENRRVIGPEHPYLNWVGHAVRSMLLRLTKRCGSLEYMDPEEQGNNRTLARLGSLTGKFCTIDLSSASDNIPRALLMSLLPMEVRDVISECLPDWYVLPAESGDKNLYPCSMIATSGNVLTPMLQSLFFLALGRVACSLAGIPTSCVCVYNDDLIISDQAFETFCDVLSAFHAVVNHKKTYGVGPYRESCGGEYWDGYDVVPTLWPRQPVPTQPAQQLQYFITLQHRFFHYPLVRMYFEDIVRTLKPGMTHSCAGEECDDLWSPWMTYEQQIRCWHYVLRTHAKPVSLADWTDCGFSTRYLREQAYRLYLRLGPQYRDLMEEALHISAPRTRELDWLRNSVSEWEVCKAYVRDSWESKGLSEKDL